MVSVTKALRRRSRAAPAPVDSPLSSDKDKNRKPLSLDCTRADSKARSRGRWGRGRIRRDFLARWRPILFVEHRSNLSIERRHFVLHNIPHNLRIETEVFMNQNVSKTRYFLPFHCGMLRAKILREFLDGFTDDFKISDDCVNRFLVLKERGFGKAAGIHRDLSSGLENVLQVDLGIPRHRRFLVE